MKVIVEGGSEIKSLVNVSDEEGWMLLYFVVSGGWDVVVEVLFVFGVDVGVGNNGG